MNYIFATKMQIFESNSKNTISTTKFNFSEPLDFNVSLFLKIDKFEGPKPHSPLKSA